MLENAGTLLHHTGVTLVEAGLGFVVANVLAIFLAITMVFVPSSDKAILPFAIALKTTPVVAMAPLLLLWFGTGIEPKVAASALICFFPALVNTTKGFYSCDPAEMDLFRVYGASSFQKLVKLRLQKAAPYIFQAFKISSSLAIVGAIVGEFVGANEGIGYVILVASYHLEIVHMFSGLAFTAVGGVVFYVAIAWCEKRVVFWESDVSDMAKRSHSPARKE
jgi:NitT/TauT family transport system permease protein